MPSHELAEGPITWTGQNDLVLQSLVITLIFVLLQLTAHTTTLILRAYWDHFIQVLYFNSKF